MPSTYKTPKLGLNDWIGTDKPKRADFNADNAILESVVSAHSENGTAHFSEAEKTRFTDLVNITTYTGDGTRTHSGSFAFTPKMIVIYPAAKAPVSMMANGDVSIRSAYATASGASKGLTLTGQSFQTTQSLSTPADGEILALNENGTTYVVVAIR